MAEYKIICRVKTCGKEFIAASNGARYCHTCREIIKVKNRRATRAGKQVRGSAIQGKEIDPKWLVRGTVSDDSGGSGSIANGSY